MKALGIFLISALAVAGGVAAATYITKKKLDKENDDNFYDDWDSDAIDDDWDFEFDEDMEVEEDGAAPTVEEAPAPAPEKPSFSDDLFNTAKETGSALDEDL